MCILFAATYPERTAALVTFSVYAKRVWSPDYPWAPTPTEREAWLRDVERTWGRPESVVDLVPSLANNPTLLEEAARYWRLSASPKAGVALGKMNTQIDVRALLPTIRVPTLVMHRTGDRDINVEEGRYISCAGSGAGRSTRPGMDSWPRSTGPPGVSGALLRSATRSRGWDSRSAPGFTRGRWSSRVRASGGSPCTSGPGWRAWPAPAKSSSRGRSRTLSRAPGSSSRTEELIL